MVGVWIEPVTAQVMMTLRAAAMGPLRFFSCCDASGRAG